MSYAGDTDTVKIILARVILGNVLDLGDQTNVNITNKKKVK